MGSRIRYCCIPSCEHNRGITDDRIALFGSHDPETKQKWREALKKLGLQYGYSLKVCMLHFHPDDVCNWKTPRLKPNAVPSLKIRSFDSLRDRTVAVDPINQIKHEPPIKTEALNEEDLDLLPEKTREHCSTTLTQRDSSQHLRSNQTTIACEYCTDTTIISTTALREHSSIATQANLKYCGNSEQSHGTEVQNSLNTPPSEKLHSCWLCDFFTPNAKSLVFHMKHCHASQLNLVRKNLIPAIQSLPRPVSLQKSLTCSKLSKCCIRKRQAAQRFFECYICKCQLEHRRAVRKHLKQHVAARNTKCEICSERFTSNELLQWHICGCDDTKIHKISCEHCVESFDSLVKCMRHLEAVHTDRTLHRCRKCPRYFGMTKIRDFHEKYYQHHKAKPYPCKFCSNTFGRKSALSNHMLHTHGKVINNATRPYLCSVCGKCFTTANHLTIHSKIHAEATIQCPDCPAKFSRLNYFNRHYQLHQNIKYKCNECNRSFATARSVESHIKKVHRKRTGPKNHNCPFCTMKFSESKAVKLHLRTHTAEKPFECEFCHKFYKYKGDLAKHMQIHVGDSIYTCDDCGQGFRYHRDLKSHSFTHYKKNKEQLLKIPAIL